ncbi:hypothetical protein GCM10009624_27380 [Gordonia sinesedis]
MQIRWLTAYLDFPAAQFGDEVTFWRAIAGSTVSPPRGDHREFATLEPFNGDPHLRVQRVESGSGGIHLDIHTDDPDAAAAEAVDLGATLVAEHDDPTTGRYLVLESPGGFPFCLVGWDGQTTRSRPIRWPGDTISIIDQVCLDIPEPLFDRECSFWSALTGWDTAPTSRPELVALRRNPALALGILLQRKPSPDPQTERATDTDGSGSAPAESKATAHLDLATNSVDDEVARHTDWGATVVNRLPRWTVMSDPVGRRYCVTDRNPRTGE